MREILFRGKGLYSGKWVEGDLLNNGYDYIKAIRKTVDEIGEVIGVEPETVGQYTGLTDKNGKKIFEGDIVKLFLIDGEESGAIRYDEIMCRFMFYEKHGIYGYDSTCEFEIIGNLHDNPEILTGEQ